MAEEENQKVIEKAIINFVLGSASYKHFKEVQLPEKIKREEEAWKLLKENRNNYTFDKINKIFDVVNGGSGPTAWWGPLLNTPNRNRIFSSGIETINNWLEEILFSGKSEIEIVNNCLGKMKIKGASYGLITLLLYLSDPEKYNVWNTATEDGLKTGNLFERTKGESWGNLYFIYNNIVSRIRDEYKLTSREMDCLICNMRNYSMVNYWWLNANPKIWDFNETPVDGFEVYTTHNEDGNKRRVYEYFTQVKPGDILIGYITSPEKKITAIAEITKGIHEIDGEEQIEFRKTRQVETPIEWDEIKNDPLLSKAEPVVNNQGSLFKLTSAEYKKIMELIDSKKPGGSGINISDKDILKDLFIPDEQFFAITDLLKNNKNIILQGPPGVGKTFIAKRLAYSILGKKDPSKVEMIQFHQSYSYEDFIQGFRPNENGQFKIKNGVFYNLCRKAKDNPAEKYFFIIDEINRGNLSKIFGEVLMLIENDKRNSEYALSLTYSKDSDDKFYVPDNVYLIGMMNTADRSLAMVDYALRRRFCFIDLIPEFGSNKFKDFLIKKGGDEVFILSIIDKINAFNEKIDKDNNLGSGFRIGHSYFCPGKGQEPDEIWYESIIESQIAPLIREYWFDNQEKAKNEINYLLDI
jgi:hypothetical protein